MPQIGWVEILIVVVLAILIIGPKDFPIMIKKIGSWVGSFKNYFNEMQNEITDIKNITEDEISKSNEIIKDKDNKKNEWGKNKQN